MHLRTKAYRLFAILLFFAPLLTWGQKKALIIFPEDEHINIPARFLKTPERGIGDSAALRFLTLKYQFYNVLTQRLVQSSYTPIGGVTSKANSIRKYKKANWYFTDSASRAKNKGKKYFAAVVDETNKNYYSLYANADSVDYIIFINKIEVGGGFFRNVFATKNYTLDVHFDVYTANMKHLGGQYLRKKVRLTRSMFWPAFVAQFNSLPEELALHFVGMRK